MATSLSIKICGNTRWEDLVKAYELGVNYVGFIFYSPSPRYIKPTKAKEIITLAETYLYQTRNKFPKFSKPTLPKKVGVFVNEKKKVITEMARFIPLDIIQLHGSESPDFSDSLKLPFWKVLQIGEHASPTLSNPTDPESLAKSFYSYSCKTFLLDTQGKNGGGGTGRVFDWQIVLDYQQHYKEKPQFILGGGLGLDNIQKAIQIAPHGVDINSGIEDAPGIKNHQKMELLVKAIT